MKNFIIKQFKEYLTDQSILEILKNDEEISQILRREFSNDLESTTKTIERKEDSEDNSEEDFKELLNQCQFLEEKKEESIKIYQEGDFMLKNFLKWLLSLFSSTQKEKNEIKQEKEELEQVKERNTVELQKNAHQLKKLENEKEEAARKERMLQSTIKERESENRKAQEANERVKKEKEVIQKEKDVISKKLNEFSEAQNAYTAFTNLSPRGRLFLDNVFKEGNLDFFIAAGAKENILSDIWDFIKSRYEDGVTDDIENLTTMFNYFYKVVNCSKNHLKLQEVNIGDRFDPIKHINSKKGQSHGEVKEIIWQGYCTNEGSGKIIKKSLVIVKK